MNSKQFFDIYIKDSRFVKPIEIVSLYEGIDFDDYVQNHFHIIMTLNNSDAVTIKYKINKTILPRDIVNSMSGMINDGVSFHSAVVDRISVESYSSHSIYRNTDAMLYFMKMCDKKHERYMADCYSHAVLIKLRSIE